MLKGSEVRDADYPIDSLFLDRWSPRAMSGEGIAEEDVLTLFEAARWAPSSGNAQPWRILYARRESKYWPLFFDLLNDTNKVWCERAAVLVLFVSKTVNDAGRPIRTHSYDTGAAWENMALQGALKGYVVHGMAGFDHDRARTDLNIPEDHAIEAMAAIGIPGDLSLLSEFNQQRENPSGRRPLSETIWEGGFPE